MKFYQTFYPFNKERYWKLVELFSVNVRKPLHSLSKGKCKQAFLSCFLAIDAKCYLIDEVFDGLDILAKKDLKKILMEILVENDAMFIISSHNLRELEDICDDFILINQNKITKSGDLNGTKLNVHKIQVAFDQEVDLKKLFSKYQISDLKQTGKVSIFLIEGSLLEIEKILQKEKPIFYECLHVRFEELIEKELRKDENHDQ